MPSSRPIPRSSSSGRCLKRSAKNAVELKNDTDQAEKTYFFMIKSGETSIGHVKNTMDNLEALGLNIDAICLYGADPKFIKGYRGGRK